MPHNRDRYISKALIKKLKFSPVVAIQGVRQCGKSFLVRELLAKELVRSQYETFDRKTSRDFATTNPETYLSKFIECAPLIIDEAQKVPDIFDAIKVVVDEQRIPGKFILLGSTEFSKATLITESLTGRMSRIRMFPLTLSETLSLPEPKWNLRSFFREKTPLMRSQLVKYLECGGMPAIFWVHSPSERELLFEDWLALTCERDLKQTPKLKLEPALARNILEKVATLDEPTAGNVSKALGKDLRKVNKHLDALEILFVLHKISPHQGSAGKAVYYLCDTGLASFLGASFERKLETHLVMHTLAFINNQMIAKIQVTHYRSSTGAKVPLLLTSGSNTVAVRIIATERMDLREVAALVSLRKKYPDIKTIAYGPGRFSLKKEKVEVFPWEAFG